MSNARYKVSCIAFVALFHSAFVQAEEYKVGFVNADLLFTNSQATKAATEHLKNDFSAQLSSLEKEDKKIEALETTIQSQKMSASELTKAKRELARVKKDFYFNQQKFQEDLQLKKDEEVAKVKALADQEIRHVAEHEHYDLVVQDAVYFSTAIDITQKVIDAMDRNTKQ